MLPGTILREGSETPTPPPIPLRAGPLTMIFDPQIAALRYLRLGDHEVIRSIFGAVRNAGWGTPFRQVTDLEINNDETCFKLSCNVTCQDGAVDFSYRVLVSGDAQGAISFRFEGRARSTFQSNRIGLCILHPVTECAGKPCMVEHSDSLIENRAFPESISPNQVFMDVRALRYEPAPGQSVEIRFEGDVFETEDQRNWSDASFKTYSTPLVQPVPVDVQAGTDVVQSVHVRLLEPQRKILPVVQGRPAQLSLITSPVLQMPFLGVACNSLIDGLSPKQTERLRALRLSHLRVDLDLSGDTWATDLRRGVELATAVGSGLHIAATVSDHSPKPWQLLADECLRLRAPVRLWIVFHQNESIPGPETVALAQAHLQKVDATILLAAGTKTAFADLNQNRPSPSWGASVAYPICPQVHASDGLTLIENLAAQSTTSSTAKQFSARPVVISPVTLRTPAELTALVPNANKPPDGLPADVDPRQTALFGAAWTLSSVARLATGGNVHSLTYYEIVGGRGLMPASSDEWPPYLAGVGSWSVFPLYHVFVDLAEQTRFFAVQSTHPLQVDGIAFSHQTRGRRVVVANLLGVTQEIKLKSGSAPAEVRYLDETTIAEATSAPEDFRNKPGQRVMSVAGKIELTMLPWAIARVDLE